MNDRTATVAALPGTKVSVSISASTFTPAANTIAVSNSVIFSSSTGAVFLVIEQHFALAQPAQSLELNQASKRSDQKHQSHLTALE